MSDEDYYYDDVDYYDDDVGYYSDAVEDFVGYAGGCGAHNESSTGSAADAVSDYDDQTTEAPAIPHRGSSPGYLESSRSGTPSGASTVSGPDSSSSSVDSTDAAAEPVSSPAQDHAGSSSIVKSTRYGEYVVTGRGTNSQG